MICGLIKIDQGSGRCLGLDVLRQGEQIRRLTGYMTQNFSFWNDLSLRENLDFVARLYQLPRCRECVQQTLENLGLEQRQRNTLASPGE